MAVIDDDDGDDNNDDDFEGVFSNDDEGDHLDDQQSFMRKKQGKVEHRVGLKQSRSFPPSLIIIGSSNVPPSRRSALSSCSSERSFELCRHQDYQQNHLQSPSSPASVS